MVAAAMLLFVQGCTTVMPEIAALTGNWVDLAGRSALADAQTLAVFREREERRYRGNPTPENALRLAVVLTVPQASDEHLEAGVELLAQLSGPDGGLEPGQRDVARSRHESAVALLETRRQSTQLSGEVESLRRELDEANKKIEELLQIERSIEHNRGRNQPEDS